jgi:hypothetical protein
MSLSFREQAAIAFAAAFVGGRDPNGWGFYQESVEAAEQLADECCKQFGHDLPDPWSGGECQRCGATE